MSYQFSVQATDQNNGPRLHYEFVVDNGVPKKLGDGTFGAVFEAVTSESKSAAVKLFYPVNDGSVTDIRNRHEMRAGSELRKTLRSSRLEALEANLVLSDGWTTEFDKSDAYKSLKKAFAQFGLAVSGHALVMPFYECTLKDLLENGGPAGRLVSGVPAVKPGAPGYEILRRMALPERERHIAAIMRQIATGLRALHAANLFHRDIKPANVMMRVAGDDIQVSLGDFGFLDDLPERAASGYGGALPLGTRHYRSPEQKDYFDLCDVSVTPKNDGSDKRLILETTDKKFVDTLIERGDIAEFSKDKHGQAGDATGYMVVSVYPGDEKSMVELDNPYETGFADEKTQVLFYKKPSGRTDLFGVGALMFDMLTLGKSPECFYDFLRPLDRRGPDGSDVSVNTIIEKYRAAINGNTTSAELASILDQVRDRAQGHYPSSEIMAVIFRCMMSRSEGAYFESTKEFPAQDFPEQEPQEQESSKRTYFDRILEDLSGLPSLRGHAESSSTRPGLPSFPTTSPLWSGKASYDAKSASGASFEEGLRRAYGWGPGVLERLVWAARRLDRISDALANICQQSDFYVDIGPHNLQAANNDTEVRPILATYQDEEQYLGAVLTGAAWSLEAGGATNSLTPLYTRFNIQAIRLDLEVPPEDGKNIQANVSYIESLPVWRGCAERDFLRIIDSSGRPGLFEITRVDRSGGVLDIDAELRRSGEGFSLGKTAARFDGLAIRRLDPVRCYLSMLAIYLHHLFFVDDRADTGIIPEEAWNYLRDIIRGSAADPRRARGPVAGLLSRRPSGVDLVRLNIARLYLKLIWLSEHPESGTEASLLGQMKGDVDELLDGIAKEASYPNRYVLVNSADRDQEGISSPESGKKDKGREFSEILREAL